MAQTVLTATGFRRKRYEDFIAEAEALAQELWGADVNLEAAGPLGKFIRNQAMARAEEHELSEAVYYSGYVETADGVSLDYAVGRRGGIIRRAAAPAKAAQAMQLTVTPGKVVTAGLIIGTAGEIDFVTTTGATDTDNNGVVLVDIEAVDPGPAGNVPPGTITVIKTPIAGVTAATNIIATVDGADAETDAQLRDRYHKTQAKGGKGTIDAIRAELIETPGVREAFVIENNLDVADGAGRPPHSFEASVLGGVGPDIAAAILRSKAAGIRAYGTQTAIVNDSAGSPQTIGFSFAVSASIYVNVSVSKNASFPQNGADLVEYEIIQYIGGTDSEGRAVAGLGLGEDVRHAKIVSAILANVPGIDDITVTLRKGTSGAYAAANIDIGTEVPETDSGKVVVTVV